MTDLKVMGANEVEIWKRLNECECVQKVFGNWCNSDFAYCLTYKIKIDAGRCVCCSASPIWFCDAGNKAIWIPPLYDPIRLERSLWGIVYNLGLDNLEIIACDFNRPDLAIARAIIKEEVDDDRT